MKIEVNTKKGKSNFDFFFGDILTVENVKLIYEGKDFLKLNVEEKKCKFCDRGEAWKTLVYRVVKDMSRKELQQILNDRKEYSAIQRRKHG